MLKSKINFRIQYDAPTKISFYNDISMYGIKIADNFKHYTRNPERDIGPKNIYRVNGKHCKNITKNKAYGMGAIALIWENIGKGVADEVNEYTKALFLPAYHSLNYTSSITGIKKPMNTKYPAYLDFENVGFSRLLMSYKQYANKSNSLFSSSYKAHLIKSTSTILAEYITKNDKLYLNPLDFNFYYKDTHQKYTGDIPDLDIFRPTSGLSKQEVLRKWNDFKYYGSNLMLPKFIPNETKKQEYLNSLVNENEELISVEELNYEKTNKDDLTRLVLQETLGEYYDFNDNFEFSINNNTYRLDIHKEQFLDSESNVLPYIAKYSSNNELESIISFKEYKSIIKETLTESDSSIKAKTIEALQNNTSLPSIHNTSLKFLKFANNDLFWFDRDNNNNTILMFGSGRIKIRNYGSSYYAGTDGGDHSTSYFDKTTYYTLFDLVKKYKEGTLNRQETFAFNNISLKPTLKETISTTYSDSAHTPSTSGTIEVTDERFMYENQILYEYTLNSNYRIEISTLYQGNTKEAYSINDGIYNYMVNNNKNFPINGSSIIYSNIDIPISYKVIGSNGYYQTISYTLKNCSVTGNYTAKDKSYVITYSSLSLQQQSNKELIRTYSMYEILFELFGVYTNIQNIDKSNADYNTTKTYLHELNYAKGEVWDIVDIQPIFIISGVTQTNYCVFNKTKQTLKKKILTDEELITYPNYMTDSNGNKYIVEVEGKLLDEPIKSVDENGNEIIITQQPKVETIQETESITDYVKFSLPRRQLKIYSKVSNYISKLKNKQINGYIVKYLDKTDNKTKVKLHTEDSISFLQNISDLQYDLVKCLPLLPYWTNQHNIYPIECYQLDPVGLLGICTFAAGILTGYNYILWPAMTVSLYTTYWVEDNTFEMLSRPLHMLGQEVNSYKGFYFFYDKKINKYYKDAFNFYLKEWEQQINGYYEDKEYNVKMRKKLSKKFTNKDSILYSESPTKVEDKNEVDFDSYNATEKTIFGKHTSIRFSFSMYFNKYFRQSRLIAKMGIIYLDYFYKRLNGDYGVWIEQILYAPDRIQFSEKRLKIRFMKQQYNKEVEGNEASIYCKFDFEAGQFIFYNRAKQEKYIFDINTHFPQWRNTYMKNKSVSKTPKNEKILKGDCSFLTISKDMIKLMKYTDKKGNTANSIYYNTSTKLNDTLTLNCWSKSNQNDYICFYTPYEPNKSYTQQQINYIYESMQDRNVYTYLYNLFLVKSPTELKDIYKLVFDKDIEVLSYIDDNIFNLNNILDRFDIKDYSDYLQTQDSVDDIQYDLSSLVYTSTLDKNTLALYQTYYLYSKFNIQCLESKDINDENQKSSNIVADELAKEILIKTLPLNNILLPSDFAKAFINNSNELLNAIFTKAEIYNIGFTNYLVSNEEYDENNPTVLIESILDINKCLITKINTENGNIIFNQAYLPLPVDVYKKFPVYSKNLVANMFCIIEMYKVQPMPTVHTRSALATALYKYFTIITYIILTIVGIALSEFDGGTTATLGIVALCILLAAQVIQLIALMVPANAANILNKVAFGLQIVSAIISMGSSIAGAVGATEALNAIQIANIVVTSIDYCFKVADTIVNAVYDKKIQKEQEKLNRKIDEYNQSQEELFKFIEDNEFEAELLNQYHPISITHKESSLYDDTYDSSIETYLDSSLSSLYISLDNYYSNRL